MIQEIIGWLFLIGGFLLLLVALEIVQRLLGKLPKPRRFR